MSKVDNIFNNVLSYWTRNVNTIAQELPKSLAETLQRFSEYDLFAAFSYFKKEFMVNEFLLMDYVADLFSNSTHKE